MEENIKDSQNPQPEENKASYEAEEAGQQTSEVLDAELEHTKEMVKDVRKWEKSVRDYQSFLLKLVIFLFILWVLFFKVIGITHMPNGDMYPRIDAGDMVLFYRLDKDVRAQDIIAVEKVMPDNRHREFYISRVVAVGGDTVDIVGDHLIINGNAVVENNIFYPTAAYEGFTTFPVKLEENQCFVLADVRNGGADSRYFGPVNKSEILGTVINVLRRNNL